MNPDDIYQQRLAINEAEAAHWRQQGERQGLLTTGLVTATLVCAGFGIWQHAGLAWGLAIAGAIGAIFSYARHVHFDNQRDRANRLAQIQREGRWRLVRDWEHLPLRGLPAPADHPYATDLDLTGHASVQHLLGTAMTPVGQETVRDWLLHPAAPADIAQRQAAIRELQQLIDWREAIAIAGQRVRASQSRYLAFVTWAEGAPYLHRQPQLVLLTRVFAVITPILMLAQLFGIFPYPLWLLLAAINLGITGLYGTPIDETLNAIGEQQAGFQSYAAIFQLILDQPFTSPLLRDLQSRLMANQHNAVAQMHRLGRIIAFSDLRRSLLGFPLQFTLLWTFHITWFLEEWQQQAGTSLRGWLAVLGEMEALIALATLAYDHPDWTMPEITEERGDVFVADTLAHPLLPPERAVGNSVSIGPAGTCVVVTGSNMSGKSTLLRAIGTSCVLASMGGPVAAKSLRMQPITLATSIRVQDSLEAGLSYFMAELRRLQQVVERTESAERKGGQILFLLDEILHGTNTAERQIAARAIILYLVRHGATGAVSTHDLALARDPDLAAVATNVHFSEQFTRHDGRLSMTFDYRLQAGIATSTNALKLAEMIGLPVDANETVTSGTSPSA